MEYENTTTKIERRRRVGICSLCFKRTNIMDVNLVVEGDKGELKAGQYNFSTCGVCVKDKNKMVNFISNKTTS